MRYVDAATRVNDVSDLVGHDFSASGPMRRGSLKSCPTLIASDLGLLPTSVAQRFRKSMSLAPWIDFPTKGFNAAPLLSIAIEPFFSCRIVR